MRKHQQIVSNSGLVLTCVALLPAIACGGAAPAEEEMAEATEPNTSTGFIDLQLPNPTSEVITQWAALPDGRTWGSTAGIDNGPDVNVSV